MNLKFFRFFEYVWSNSNDFETQLISKHHLDNEEGSRIEGFNIYRDNDLIAWVPTEENTYTDSDIIFGQEYCYKVKAVYEEGESNPTSTECGSVTDPADFSVVYMDGG